LASRLPPRTSASRLAPQASHLRLASLLPAPASHPALRSPPRAACRPRLPPAADAARRENGSARALARCASSVPRRVGRTSAPSCQVEGTASGGPRRHGSQGRHSPRGIASPFSGCALRSPCSTATGGRRGRHSALRAAAPASCLPPRASRLVPPASHLPPRTSHLPPRTSHLPARTLARASRLPPLLPAPASHPALRLPPRAACRPRLAARHRRRTAGKRLGSCPRALRALGSASSRDDLSAFCQVEGSASGGPRRHGSQRRHSPRGIASPFSGCALRSPCSTATGGRRGRHSALRAAAPASCLPPRTSHLPARTLARASRLAPRTSHLAPRTSRLALSPRAPALLLPSHFATTGSSTKLRRSGAW
jgi:hypothetical protein